MTPLRVLLLTGPRDYQRYVADQLCAQLNVVQVVVEDATLRKPKNKNPPTAKQRLRSASPQLFERLAAFKRLLTWSRGERKARKLLSELETGAQREFEEAVGPLPEWPDVPRQHVPWINGKKIVRECAELSPDVTIVFGTGILKPPMIRVACTATLNAHTSLLPDFKGTSSEFWQVLNQRLDCAGVTVHYIDEGVDTGEILLQRKTAIEGRADPYRLRLHNVLMVPEMFAEAVAQLEHGSAPRLRQGTTDLPTYRSKDMTFAKQVEMIRVLGYDV